MSDVATHVRGALPATLLMRVALCAILGLSIVAAPEAESIGSIPNPRTRDGTWVTDVPGQLRADTISRLNATLAEFERTSGAEMAVVVIGSLDGLSIEEAAVELFELWGIGKKQRDNGLLLLWSTGDRRVRVEVGYGLEGVLPDGKVGALLDSYVIPRFRAGDFDEGIIAGVDALIDVARNEPVALPALGTESYSEDSTQLVGPWLVLGGIPLALGSLFGYRRWRRYHRRRCPQCQAHMARLSESEDDAMLESGQQAEERVGSVDYDVWKCASCSHHFTLRYPKWVTRYSKCPQCHHRTKTSTETVLKQATTTSSGSAQVVERCGFCSFHREYTKVLPRVQAHSSRSGGGGSRGSFGGGRSGGGGASRGY